MTSVFIPYPFTDAIADGQYDVVHAYLNRGVGVDDELNEYGTALHNSVLHGRQSIVELLLLYGANINSRNTDGATPLHLACRKGFLEITRVLLRGGAATDIEMASFWGDQCRGATPLHCAAASGSEVIVQELLDHGAQIDALDKWSFCTPLVFAAQNGHESVVALLLSRGAAVDGDRRAYASPLILAVSRNYEGIVRQLLEKGADVNRWDEDGNTSIHSAALLGFENIVRLLLEHRGEKIDLVGGSGRTARWFAAEAGHEDIEALLVYRTIEQGQPVDQHGLDIMNDSSLPFKHFPEGRLMRDIEAAQKLLYIGSNSEASWRKRLRFVVAVNRDECKEYDLEVLEPYRHGEAPGEPYVAVSYCWGSHSNDGDAPLRIRVPDKEGGYTIRQTLARPEVLRRSLAFAAAKGIKRIWIDQECIHQQDDDDKRSLIGVMHKIYRQATITLAVLGRHVQSIDDIRGLPSLLDPMASRELKDRIFADRWTKRAWTTQEYINTLKPRLSYLIGWGKGLDESADIWQEVASITTQGNRLQAQNVPREWELSSGQFFSMSFMTMGNPGAMMDGIADSQTERGDTFTLCCKSLEIMSWWNTENDSTGASHEEGTEADILMSDFSNHLSMAMLAALATLERKRNLLVSDRLSILANLTHYPFILDTEQVIENRLSFTACIIAMALFNGDLSPILDRPFGPSGSTRPLPTWLPPEKLSLQSMNQTRMMPCHIFTGRSITSDIPTLVVNGKLLVRGILWEIEPFTELLALRETVCEMLNGLKNSQGIHRIETAKVLLQMLVRKLFECQQPDLLELVVAAARNDQLSSPAEITSILGELQAWYANDSAWPSRVSTVSENSTSDERAPAPGDTALLQLEQPIFVSDPSNSLWNNMPSELGNGIIKWIYYTICTGTPLPVGELRIGDTKLLGLFKLDLHKHNKVLVPVSELNYEFGSNHTLHILDRESFWCVGTTGQKASAAEVESGIERLAKVVVDEREFCISEEILKNEWATDIYGAWSPRLCAKGILTQDASQSWKMVPLGPAAAYHFIA